MKAIHFFNPQVVKSESVKPCLKSGTVLNSRFSLVMELSKFNNAISSNPPAIHFG